MKARKTAVDIVLDNPENANENVCSKVLSKVVAFQHRIY